MNLLLRIEEEIGEKAKLFIPILRKVCNNLPMFFRYMNEEDDENVKDNVIELQYKRSNDFTNANTIQSLISVYLNKGWKKAKRYASFGVDRHCLTTPWKPTAFSTQENPNETSTMHSRLKSA